MSKPTRMRVGRSSTVEISPTKFWANPKTYDELICELVLLLARNRTKYTKQVVVVTRKLTSEIFAHACRRSTPYPAMHARPDRTVGRLDTFVVITNIANTKFRGILQISFVAFLLSVQKKIAMR